MTSLTLHDSLVSCMYVSTIVCKYLRCNRIPCASFAFRLIRAVWGDIVGSIIEKGKSLLDQWKDPTSQVLLSVAYRYADVQSWAKVSCTTRYFRAAFT